MPLITSPNLDAGDDFYEALLSAHHGLEVEGSHAFNARLILLLANHIGRQDVLLEALSAAARANLVASAAPATPATPATPAAPTSSAPPVSTDAPTTGDASPRGQA